MSNTQTLHTASEQGDLQTVQNLVQQNGSLNSDYINRSDSHGRTALHYASQKGNLVLVRYLILVNAEINVADNNGLSPLDLAIEGKHQEVAQLLRLCGGQSRIQPSVQPTVQEGSTRVDQNGLLCDVTLINNTSSDIHNKHLESTLTAHVNLAADKLGATILYASNEWFAPATCLLKPGRGTFTPNTFVATGQVYDGWETARHGAIRRGGKDFCYIKLGTRGIIRGFDIDTNFFTGNYVPAASVDGYCHPDGSEPTAEDLHKVKWVEILPKVPLSGSAQHFHRIVNSNKWTHLRFNVYPDGGVARLKVYGDVSIDWSKMNQNQLVDLASILNGGKVVSVSDSFYSSQDNCLMPDRGINMGDGWETRRSRGKNHREWIVIKLGRPGTIEQAEIDTNHFRGNYPYQVTVHGCFGEGSEWVELLPVTLLEAHKQHYFDKSSLKNVGPVSHVRVTIYPDGGISRIRLNGKVYNVKMMQQHEIESSLKHAHKAVAIDEGNFYSFGEVATPRELEKSNLRYVWNTKGNGTPSARQFYSLRLSPQKLPTTVSRLDRFSSAQTYIPVNAQKYLVIACLPSKSGSIPDLLNFGAFIVGGGQAVNLKPGVWHQVIALDKDSEFIVASESFLEKKDIESIAMEPYKIQVNSTVAKM